MIRLSRCRTLDVAHLSRCRRRVASAVSSEKWADNGWPQRTSREARPSACRDCKSAPTLSKPTGRYYREAQPARAGPGRRRGGGGACVAESQGPQDCPRHGAGRDGRAPGSGCEGPREYEGRSGEVLRKGLAGIGAEDRLESAAGRSSGAGGERLTLVKMSTFLAQNLAQGAKNGVLRIDRNLAIVLPLQRMRP